MKIGVTIFLGVLLYTGYSQDCNWDHIKSKITYKCLKGLEEDSLITVFDLYGITTHRYDTLYGKSFTISSNEEGKIRNKTMKRLKKLSKLYHKKGLKFKPKFYTDSFGAGYGFDNNWIIKLYPFTGQTKKYQDLHLVFLLRGDCNLYLNTVKMK